MEKHLQQKKKPGAVKGGRKDRFMRSVSERRHGLPSSLDGGFDKMSQVMFELNQLKKQSQRLDQINQLHKRLAGALSISDMIEAYSIWLMPIVEHELIGYYNYATQKKVLFCSGHGPNRRWAIGFAERMIEEGASGSEGSVSQDSQHGHKWIFESLDATSILLILKKNSTSSHSDMQIISDSLAVLAESLQRGVEYDDLFEQATTDALTGLSNRRVFAERVKSMMDCHKRYGSPLTMLSLDLDYFKQINDNLGHQVGDEVLKSVAAVLQTEVRSTDLLVRMGGDEFLLVLDNTDKEQARTLAERLVRKIDGLDVWANDHIKLGASIGLAQLDRRESLSTWLERTDDLLYHAKIEGRSKVATDSQQRMS